MKKTISAILALSLVLGSATMALADNNTNTSAGGTTTSSTTQADPNANLTPEQKAAREQFLGVYMDKMTQIVDLRVQTKAAVDNNENLYKQIKDKLKALVTGENKDAVDKIKAIAAQNKDLVTQAKTLDKQRQDLRKQFQSAIKAKDVNTMKAVKDQILAINNQITTIKSQVAANRNTAQPLRTQVKSNNDKRKALRDQLKTAMQQAKDAHTKIVSEDQAKNQLWVSYKADIQSKDYTSAGNTLQSIIDAKKQIISDIQARGTILSNLLSSIN